MKKTSIYLLCILAGFHGMSLPAWGDSIPTKSCALIPACLTLFEQAQQQSTNGQLADALVSYSRAYEISADPRLLYSIARVLHKQGLHSHAIPYYRQFLNSSIDGDAPIEKAKEYLAQCESLLAQQRTQPSPQSQPKADRDTPIVSTSLGQTPTSRWQPIPMGDKVAHQEPRVESQKPVSPKEPGESLGTTAAQTSLQTAQSTHRSRPVWRVVSGGLLLGGGLLVGGFGLSALSVNNQCRDGSMDISQCNPYYKTGTIGIGLVSGGSVLLLSGVVMLAIPGGRR